MIIKESGYLKTFTGDSYTIAFDIKGLEPTSLYCIYFQVNIPGSPIIKKQEITTDENGNHKLSFYISADENNKRGRFSYGVKACRDEQEDTIKTGYIHVNSLEVEGFKDGQLCNS